MQLFLILRKPRRLFLMSHRPGEPGRPNLPGFVERREAGADSSSLPSPGGRPGARPFFTESKCLSFRKEKQNRGGFSSNKVVVLFPAVSAVGSFSVVFGGGVGGVVVRGCLGGARGADPLPVLGSSCIPDLGMGPMEAAGGHGASTGHGAPGGGMGGCGGWAWGVCAFITELLPALPRSSAPLCLASAFMGCMS